MKIPVNIDEFLAEEIGLHLGDGSMNFYNNKGLYQLRGHIIDDKNHYQTRIKGLYKQIFNINIKLREMPSTGVYGFQIWSNKIVDYKSKILKLPLGKKVNFIIPKEIRNDLELAKHFLRGYYDTDGCLYLEKKNNKLYPRVEFSTISNLFFEQLQEILKQLGFNFTCYREKRAKYDWNDLHKIRINGVKMTNKWFNEIKPANLKHLNKFKRIRNL